MELDVVQNNDVLARTFARGIGLGTQSRLSYALPEKVYDRFEFFVGLHRALGKRGKVAFRVYADGEAVYYSGLLTGEDPAQKISLAIWGVKELSFTVESRNEIRGANYAVIAEPVLFKAKQAPPAGRVF